MRRYVRPTKGNFSTKEAVVINKNFEDLWKILDPWVDDIPYGTLEDELTFGNEVDKTVVELDGTIRFEGDATVWDDLRFPATQLRVNPATLKPDFDFTEVGFLFDSGSTETLYIIAQIPHSWKVGSSIYPHIHWMPTNTDTGNVLWRMEYKWINIGADGSGAFTSIDTLDAADGTSYKHQIADLPAIDGTGKTISSILSIKLSRIGGDASDTYNADALLKEFDIHYEIDTIGSREEYVK